MVDGSQENRLFLYCTDLEFYPENLPVFIRQCQEYGLLSGAADNLCENDYLVGERFLQLVSFLGCSPYLKTEPEDEHDHNYCHIHVENPAGGIRFISGKKPTIPSCPVCKKSLKPDNDLINRWHKDNTIASVLCDNCNDPVSIFDLNWRKNAGFVNFTLEISGIFPKEAIPGESLLSWLQSITDSKWKYFYI